jgi:hypothetical protein
MMKALPIGGSLFLHALRSPGLVGVVAGAAVMVLSLGWVTSFGLGRELLMVREASFGTLFLGGFLSALVCGLLLSQAEAQRMLGESAHRAGTPLAGPRGLVVATNLAGVWAALTLAPFVVAAASWFHERTAAFVAALCLGVVSLAGAAFGHRDRRSAAVTLCVAAGCAAASLAVCAGDPVLAELPVLFLYSFASLILGCSACGFFFSFLPASAGAVVSICFLVLSNMKGAIAGSGAASVAWGWMPDLSGVNPSMAASETPGPGLLRCAGAFGYAALVAIAVLVLVDGIALVREGQR